MAKTSVDSDSLEEAPVAQSTPKRNIRTYDQASRDYRKPSLDCVTAHDPRHCNNKTIIKVVRYSNGYLTGISPRGGVPVKEKEVTLKEAYAIEHKLLTKYRSRLTMDEPDLDM